MIRTVAASFSTASLWPTAKAFLTSRTMNVVSLGLSALAIGLAFAGMTPVLFDLPILSVGIMALGVAKLVAGWNDNSNKLLSTSMLAASSAAIIGVPGFSLIAMILGGGLSALNIGHFAFSKNKSLLGLASAIISLASLGLIGWHVSHSVQVPVAELSSLQMQEGLNSFENSAANGLTKAEFDEKTKFYGGIKAQLAAANLAPDASPVDIEKALGLPVGDGERVQNFFNEMDKAANWFSQYPDKTYTLGQPPQAIPIAFLSVGFGGGALLHDAVYRGDNFAESNNGGAYKTLAYSSDGDRAQSTYHQIGDTVPTTLEKYEIEAVLSRYQTDRLDDGGLSIQEYLLYQDVAYKLMYEWGVGMKGLNGADIATELTKLGIDPTPENVKMIRDFVYEMMDARNTIIDKYGDEIIPPRIRAPQPS